MAGSLPTTLLGVAVSVSVMLILEWFTYVECRKLPHWSAAECSSGLAVGVVCVLAIAVFLLVNLSR